MSKRIVLVGLLLVVAAAAAQWPEHRGGAHRAGIESGGPPTDLAPLWQSDHTAGWQSVAIGEFAYVASAKSLVAVDPHTGQTVWKQDVPQDGGVVVAAGRILSASAELAERRIIAWDAHSGDLEWDVNFGSSADIPAIAGNAAFVTTYDGRLLRLELSTGQTVWSAQVPRASFSPMIAGTKVIVADQSTGIHAFNFDGSKAWVVQITGTPAKIAYADRHVFVVSSSGNVAAIVDGKIVWEKLGVIWGFATPVYSDGLVYLHSEFGTLHALRASTGEEVWSRALGSRNDSSDAAGRPPPFDLPPSAGAGHLVVATQDGFLLVVNTTTGEIREEHELGGIPQNGPSARGSILIVPLKTGLVAFHGTPHEATHTGSEESTIGPGALIAVFTVCLVLAARRN